MVRTCHTVNLSLLRHSNTDIRHSPSSAQFYSISLNEACNRDSRAIFTDLSLSRRTICHSEGCCNRTKRVLAALLIQTQHSTTDVPTTTPTQFDIDHASSLRALAVNRHFCGRLEPCAASAGKIQPGVTGRPLQMLLVHTLLWYWLVH